MDGALLVNKHAGVSSFGIVEILKRELAKRGGFKRKDMPKLGHGGTLDPFATGLLIVLVGRGVKLARYFLGAVKSYEGTIRFGQTTLPGDPTAPISEESKVMPESLEKLREMARKLTVQPYLQMPPMFSAKKKNGKPLYELARAGIEVEREQKTCHLYAFDILEYAGSRARFRLVCSSGTYVRTLAQDFGRLFGTVALLEQLSRTASGVFELDNAMRCDQIVEAWAGGKKWDELSCWIPFDRLLDNYGRAQATADEKNALLQGKRNVLFDVLKRARPPEGPLAEAEETNSRVAIFSGDALVGVACRIQGAWSLERMFSWR